MSVQNLLVELKEKSSGDHECLHSPTRLTASMVTIKQTLEEGLTHKPYLSGRNVYFFCSPVLLIIVLFVSLCGAPNPQMWDLLVTLTLRQNISDVVSTWRICLV